MVTQTTSISLRDRCGASLRNNRLVISVEILLVIISVLLQLQSRVVLLLLLGWLSLWLRRDGWKNIGMSQPSNWWQITIAGIGAGIIYQLFSIGLLVPALHRFTNTTLDLSQFDSLQGNFGTFLIWLAVSWTFAAFGEELVFRGYILNRLLDLFGKSQIGWGIALIISSIFFGLGHIYQGIAGVIETFVFGIVIAFLYTMTKRNLWLPIIFHGMVDTIGFLLIFFGLYP